MTRTPNHGLNLELEKQQQSPEDWVFGAVSQPCLTDIPEERREAYLPQGEVQRGVEDTMDCASRGPINVLEAKFMWLFSTTMSPENQKWLQDNGYYTFLLYGGGGETGGVEFSDAFVAINSGTTRQGNSLKAPLEAIRKHGLIPKSMLPLLPGMTWEEYHDPKRITPEMRKLGLEFARRFTINYERVQEVHYGELLKDDMLVVAGYAWPSPVEGVYPKTDAPPNHVFVCYKNPKYYAFDNYLDTDGDFIKKLAPDYDLLDYGYRVFISKETVPQPSFLSRFIHTFFKRK